MRVLLTNDDGIDAPGLRALIEAFKPLGEVTVVAPDVQRSAAGHSITFHEPVRITRHEQHDNVIEYAITGTPSDCVLMGLYELMPERPDIVISGINHGANMGFDITYSGTVSAAMEGMIQGTKSIAVSLHGRGPVHYETAAIYAVKFAEKMVSGELAIPEQTFLSINVPDLSSDKVKGVRFTRIGRSVYNQYITKRTDPQGRDYYWISGDLPRGLNEADTDFEAIEANCISVTPVSFDLTDYKTLSALREAWNEA
ncbi:MAG: 5'/3'-nucleotidase SurE [bacterium]|nr:5'/3'-nucleotidase SurE [bacterium]